MWNEQHDSILQKEFGFYFSLDNEPRNLLLCSGNR